MTLRARITLIPNIHLLDISVLLAVLKIPGNSLLSEILPCCSHKIFDTLFSDEVKYKTEIISCLYCLWLTCNFVQT